MEIYLTYSAAALVGLAFGGLYVWLAHRDDERSNGRHTIRRRRLRFGAAHEIRRHVRGGRVRTWSQTFRARRTPVVSHELTTRNARHRVANLIEGHTVLMETGQFLAQRARAQ